MDFTGKGQCVCGNEMEGSGGSVGSTSSTTWRNCECGMKALFYKVSEDHELYISIKRKDKRERQRKTKEKLLCVFKLADIEVLDHWDIKNGYYGEDTDWLLVKTKAGYIEIGWRSKVISINWKDTGIKYLIGGDVTHDEYSCHAWGYDMAVKYLTGLKLDAMKPLKSLMRQKAEKDPLYAPHCLKCIAMYRMEKIENFYWKCRCGAIHDERD